MTERRAPDPLHVFRFDVELSQTTIGAQSQVTSLGHGAFAECTGLEATMEPKVIKEGGRNLGAVQRVGPVTFGTVVLRRGMMRGGQLWNLFTTIAGGASSLRLQVSIHLQDMDGRRAMSFELENALPVKIKMADLNAKSTEVGIEELHLAHEGLTRREASGG